MRATNSGTMMAFWSQLSQFWYQRTVRKLRVSKFMGLILERHNHVVVCERNFMMRKILWTENIFLNLIFVYYLRDYIEKKKELKRDYLTKSRRHPSKPTSSRSQFSHFFMSFLTKSWEWSIFGAAWKTSPTGSINKQKVA